ncbi:MAG: hypothetical protein JNL70_02545 [Saprospiraceae bacterium]|nr:hypothetical protein [Saprospiraceae bacterium]
MAIQLKPIVEPIEIRFNPWHVWGRMIWGVFFVLWGLSMGYVVFFHAKTANSENSLENLQKIAIIIIPIVIGYFGGIHWSLKRLRMNRPRMIFYPDRFEYAEFNGRLISISWHEIRRLGYHWQDNSTFVSTYTIWIERLTQAGLIEKIDLNVKALKPNKDFIYQQICLQANVSV